MSELYAEIDRVLKAAGIPIHGVSGQELADIDICFKDEASSEQREEAARLVAEYVPGTNVVHGYDESRLTASTLSVLGMTRRQVTLLRRIIRKRDG